MPQYSFDIVSLRGPRICRRRIDCTDDAAAVDTALALCCCGFLPAHLEVREGDRLVWSSRPVAIISFKHDAHPRS